MPTALHALAGVNSVSVGGQVILGISVSFTVTLKVQVLVSPAPSVTLHVTIVIPLGKVDILFAPLAVGVVPPLTQIGCPVGKLQLSVAMGVV